MPLHVLTACHDTNLELAFKKRHKPVHKSSHNIKRRLPDNNTQISLQIDRWRSGMPMHIHIYSFPPRPKNIRSGE